MDWTGIAMRIAGAGVICLLTFVSDVAAQNILGRPDAQRGAELSAKLCVNCHLIGQDTQATGRVKADVPTFREIANLDGQTSDRMTALIFSPKHPMPTIGLSRDNIAHIVAYIETLKTTDD